jgi:hypothetical protein
VIVPKTSTTTNTSSGWDSIGAYSYVAPAPFTYSDAPAATSTTYKYTYNPADVWAYNPDALNMKGATTSTTTTTSYAGGCVDLKNDLYLGVEDFSSDVSLLQKYLGAASYLSASSTGFYGVRTQAAVKAFQKANKINQTGYAGPMTRAKIKSLTCK